MFYFHPENWGRWTHFDEHIFQLGGSTTNQLLKGSNFRKFPTDGVEISTEYVWKTYIFPYDNFQGWSVLRLLFDFWRFTPILAHKVISLDELELLATTGMKKKHLESRLLDITASTCSWSKHLHQIFQQCFGSRYLDPQRINVDPVGQHICN